MDTNSYSIFDFLKYCGGSWRNTLYVPCGVCIHPCRAEQRGALVVADGYGRPRAISVVRYEAITGQRIDPDECIGTLQRYAFDRVFQEFAVWECEHIGDCLLCRLDSEVSARPLQREPKAALEQSLLTEDRERPLKRSAPPKSGRARSKCLCSVDRRASQESE